MADAANDAKARAAAAKAAAAAMTPEEKAAAKLAKKLAKQQKKDEKQGKKWGNEVSRQSENGGLKCTIVPNCDLDDSWNSMKETIKVCNAKLASQKLSCVALSASGKAEYVIVGVSTWQDGDEGLNASDFLAEILKAGPADTKAAEDNTSTQATAFIACNPEKEQFGLKIKDAYQQAAFLYMKKLGLVPEDSSSEEDSDDDDVPFGLNDV